MAVFLFIYTVNVTARINCGAKAGKLLCLCRHEKGGALFLFDEPSEERQKSRARPAEIYRQGNYRKAESRWLRHFLNIAAFKGGFFIYNLTI